MASANRAQEHLGKPIHKKKVAALFQSEESITEPADVNHAYYGESSCSTDDDNGAELMQVVPWENLPDSSSPEKQNFQDA